MNQGHEGEYFFAFDIETVPDVEAGRRLYGIDGGIDGGLEGLDDRSVAKAMRQLRMQESGQSFVRLYLHRVVAVSGVLRRRARSGESADIRIWSLGAPESSEKDLVEAFFRLVDLRAPTLVTWNGSGFDLPVLVYRALHLGVSAGRYFETRDPDFRFNNYLNRYHERHNRPHGRVREPSAPGRRPARGVLPRPRTARQAGMKGEDVEGGTSPGRSARSVTTARRTRSSSGSSTFASTGSGGGSDDAELAHELALVRAAVRDRPHLQAFADVREP